ncbi:MAG: hypothetical protein DRQ55_15650 [Planctomycetota bacterium]|nr:MAG: hypothetical protein DRQ55_15650 [Planctomycetota bacterium]
MNHMLSALGAIALCASTALGGVVYVDDDAPPGGDGQSWATAYRFLQDGLADAAASGGSVTEIRVGQGLYRPDLDAANPAGTGDLLATFQLLDGVRLAGGYAGLGAPDPDARDVSLFVSTLGGDLLGDDGPGFADNVDNSWHVVTGSLTDATAIIDGFTVTGGNAAGPEGAPAYHASGGGMLVVNGSPTVRCCTFEANSAAGWGAGMVVNDGGSAKISGSTFLGNVAQRAGGGLRRGETSVEVTDSAFISNRAEDGGLGGGAIGSLDSDLLVTESLFFNNYTAGEGGVSATVIGETVVINSTLIGNRAANAGGGLCTTSGGITDVSNSIIALNEAPSDAQIFNMGQQTVTRMVSSSTQGGLGGFGVVDGGGNIDAVPLFVQASSPGPDGLWATGDEILGDLRLTPGSPCVDAGDNALVPFGTNADFDDNVRFFDDPTTADTGVAGALGGSAVVDMGPFERGAPPSGLWTDLGNALGTPRLAGSGALLGGEPTTLLLVDASPGALAYLVLGITELSAPFKQGLLVPNPDFVVPLPVDGAGSVGVTAAWYPGLPSGISLTSQFWVPDVSGPSGFTASNGLRSTTL